MEIQYRVGAPLGVGTDGPVHRAVADRLGAHAVAIRRLAIPVGAARRALRRDAEIVAALGHPALAVIDDIVDLDDGTVLVAGTLGTHGTLADRLLLGPLPVDEALVVIRTVGVALSSAHRLGLTHGRLSPTNVIFTDDGPVVCDLVQAAALGRHHDGDGAAADAAALIHLATSMVDGNDRSARAGAYRALCRWSAESGADLDGLIAAFGRLDAVAATPPQPVVLTTATHPVDRHAGHAAGLVLAASLFVGVVVGVVATMLPALG